MKIYLVGGALRDRLLGLPVKDRDWVVVGATVEEMLARGYRQVGRDFPVFLDPRSKEEYALARTERKAGNGYTGFVVHASPEVTLEEDLQRRDLSINAMAEDAEGRLIDPYGGRADLDKRVLRHVSPAFAEDPLRVLRVARFAARFAHLGFRVADETLALMRDMSASGELTHLVPERVWQELQRALEESSPAVFFETLRACAALAVILPELEALFGVPQDPATHRESDVGRHSLLALQEAAALGGDTAVRFAALCHDLGKGHSSRQHWPAHPGHEEAGARSIVALCARLKAPVEHRELARLASLLHARIQQAAALNAEQLLALLEDMDALRRPRRAGQLLRVCEALARCRPGKAEEAGAARALLQRAAAAAAGLSAEALVAAGLRGPAVGEQLRLQRISVIGELLKAST